MVNSLYEESPWTQQDTVSTACVAVNVCELDKQMIWNEWVERWSIKIQTLRVYCWKQLIISISCHSRVFSWKHAIKRHDKLLYLLHRGLSLQLRTHIDLVSLDKEMYKIKQWHIRKEQMSTLKNLFLTIIHVYLLYWSIKLYC